MQSIHFTITYHKAKMAVVLKSIFKGYNDLFVEASDVEHFKGTYLVKTPFPLLTIICSYLYFVKYYGPKMMEDRKPFQLKRIMLLYNVAQVAINLYAAVAVSC